MELDRELTRRRMESVTSYDAFIDLVLELGLVQETVFFDFVFTHALSGGRGGGIAARLLVELDPPPTRSCEELLAEVAKSNWDVSMKEVPFYFISCFGKPSVRDAYHAFIRTADLPPEQKLRVETVAYWTSSPSARLIRSYLIRSYHD